MGILSFLDPSYIVHSSPKNTVQYKEDEVAKVESLSNVNKALSRIMLNASALSARKSLPVQISAIDMTRETGEVNAFLNHIKEGEIPKTNDEASVIVGQALLDKLGIRKGQKLIIQFSDKNGDIQSELLWVTTVYDTGVESIDQGTILVPLETMRKYLRYDKGEYTTLSVLINDQAKLNQTEKKVREIFKSNNTGEVVDWKKSQADLSGFIYMKTSSGDSFIYILGLIVSLGNLNTILMSVMERRREFGMMRAIGMKSSEMIKSVVYEAAAIALIGVGVGYVLGTISHLYIKTAGIDISSRMQDAAVANALFDPILRSTLYFRNYIQIGLAFTLICVLFSLYPALKLRGLKPVEVLTN